MNARQENFFPLGNDIYLTKTIYRGGEYYHIRKFVYVNNSVRPTKVGVVLKKHQLRTLKSLLNQMEVTESPAVTEPTPAPTTPPVPEQTATTMVHQTLAQTPPPAMFHHQTLAQTPPPAVFHHQTLAQTPPSAVFPELQDFQEDDFLVKATINAEKENDILATLDAEKKSKLQRRFYPY